MVKVALTWKGIQDHMSDVYGAQKQVLVRPAQAEGLGRGQEPHALEHFVEGEQPLSVRAARHDARHEPALPARRRPRGVYTTYIQYIYTYLPTYQSIQP